MNKSNMGDRNQYVPVNTTPLVSNGSTIQTPISNGITQPDKLPPTNRPTSLPELEHSRDGDTCESPIQRDRPHSFKKHQSRTFTYLDAVFILKGIGTYIFDVVTDILACIKYFSKGDFWWAILTMVFILLASITVQISSFRWFVDDYSDERHSKKRAKGFFRKMLELVVSVIVHVLQLATLNRYMRCLYFGWKSRQSTSHHKKYYIWKVFEQRDLTMLRLLEAFMEAGPQLVLQIYIMLELYTMSLLPQFYWITALSAISSLISLAWALEAYHKALRESLENKYDMNYFGFALRFTWRICMITSRVTSMALFAMHFKWWIFPAMFVHWAVMTAWLIEQKTEFYDTRREEIPFCCVIAVVHIFCFFNMKEGRTRLRASVYYMLMLFENTTMVLLWYSYSGQYIETEFGQYSIIALSFVLGSYFAGIATMGIYYTCCHPNRLHGKGVTHLFAQRRHADQVDTSRDVPDGGGHERGNAVIAKRCSNLFSSAGRRHLYQWEIDELEADTTEASTVQDGKTIRSEGIVLRQNSTNYESSV